MTDPTQPEHSSSRSAGGASDPSSGHGSGRGVDAGAILEQIREVVDDLAERAGPTVRQVSAKAAEVIATAADRAAPLAQRAGEATAEASGKLAERSRTWASEVRDQLGGDGDAAPGSAGGPVGGTSATGTGGGTGWTGTSAGTGSTGTSTGATGGAATSTGATGGPEFPGSAPADQPVADAPSDTISNG